MTNLKIIVLISLCIVFSPTMAAVNSYFTNFNSVKQAIDACLPVKPLPPLLTIADIEALEKDSGPQWCNLLYQMGYICPKPQNIMLLPPETKQDVKNGRIAFERAAEQCLVRSSAKLHIIMKRKLLAYVGYQYECDKLHNPKVCQMAKDIAIDFLYGYPNENAVKTRIALERLMNKAKKCNTRGSMQEYCKKLGVSAHACAEL
ncbi:hypothetical protein QUF74_16380 [Candidatus Halobeggiatoa sp. HSG11]|nr:hypothetical protein [Candidatus Halobeggiatoa sp. HSG11]